MDSPKPLETRAAEAAVVKQMLAGNPNDPTLNPTMPLNVSEQLVAVYRFAQRNKYDEAAKILAEVLNRTK
jgi:hypothetical protein